MLKPSRSETKGPSVPSAVCDAPEYQKKYTSHAAKPKANRMLNPDAERRPLHLDLPDPTGLSLADISPLRRGLDFISRLEFATKRVGDIEMRSRKSNLKSDATQRQA